MIKQLLLIICVILNSCSVTHHKKELIDFRKNQIPANSLRLNGYYFAELEREYGEYKKVKSLWVLFIYEDGFVVDIGIINGLYPYYCAQEKSYENTYESAHKAVELMLQSQKSEIKRTKRICGFAPNDITNKGLAEIHDEKIKIQLYTAESRNPHPDHFLSYYLYELNGSVNSDSSFVIKGETEYRNHHTTIQSTLFRFRQTEQKPSVENYFKKNKHRFK